MAGRRRPEVVINVRTSASASSNGWRRRRLGAAHRLSREPQALETAGGIRWRALLGADPFLVNGDVYCEVDLERLRRVALGERLAHLVLVPNPTHHPGGDFTLDAGRIGNAAAPRYTYAGVAVISPALFAGVDAGSKAQLAPLLRAAAERRLVSGELFEVFQKKWCTCPENTASGSNGRSTSSRRARGPGSRLS
jgi:NDP-sugar pyrophosphorylase family protein